MDYRFFFIAVYLIFSLLISGSDSHSVMKGGSHFSVENPADVLGSPTGVFTAGFYPVGDNAYCFAIWFSKPSCIINNCTVVWMANRDFPVNGKRSQLILHVTGNLVLTDAGKSIAWSTETVSAAPVELRLHDNGNLVMMNTEGVDVWQSFDFPTDTLLPSQNFTRNLELVSSRSSTNFSSGFYNLFFDYNNVIRLRYDGPDVSSVYWPDPWLHDWDNGRFPYNSSRIASFDSLGEFTSSDRLYFRSSDYGEKIQRRLTLDSDGNLRLYSRKMESWVVSWQAKSRICEIHGICGANSYCSYDLVSGQKCSCLRGHKQKKTGDWSFGCEPEFEFSCGNDSDVGFLKLKNIEFYGNDYGFVVNVTLETCEKICLEDCNCKGFQFGSLDDNLYAYCSPKTLLFNGNRDPSWGADSYVKVPNSILSSVASRTSSRNKHTCSTQPPVVDNSYHRNYNTLETMLWVISSLGALEIVALLIYYRILIRPQKVFNHETQRYPLEAIVFRRFTYSELRKATKNFTDEIGRGATGIVYKGTLADNRVAAIKRLNTASQGEAEFLAEVSTIGKLNHMNLIDIWGYCAEGKHRLLVYEYMENGSLTENLSSKTLDWYKRFDIALGTARGLAYLHEECLEWVLHCDVKPQNILLDSNFQPKVSDFGLSKLLSRDDMDRNSTFSKIRGTRGYMAPEWPFNLPITSKVDVYSYGIVVLELISGKSATIGSPDGNYTEQRSLVKMMREKKSEGNGWIEEIVDPMLKEHYGQDKMELVIELALQCVEEDRDQRPTMSKIVEMLLQLHRNDHFSS